MTNPQGVNRSLLSQPYGEGETTVQVEIYKVEGADGWTLEIVEVGGRKTTWGASFATEQDALDEFTDGIELLGLSTLIDPGQDDFPTVH